jgi:hypothetical protein
LLSQNICAIYRRYLLTRIEKKHENKGLAACILLALVFNGNPLGRNDLIVATGYKKDAVEDSLQILEELHLVPRVSRYHGWCLAARVDQLALPGLFEDEQSRLLEGEEDDAEDDDEAYLTWPDPVERRVEKPSSSESKYDRRAEKQPSVNDGYHKIAEKPTSCIQTRKRGSEKPASHGDAGYLPSEKPTSPGEIQGRRDKKPSSPVNSVNAVVEIYPQDPHPEKQVERISSSSAGKLACLPPGSVPGRGSTGQNASSSGSQPGGLRGSNLSDGQDPRLLRAFHSAGLMLTSRTRLLALKPYVTPGYVRAHYARLKANGMASHTGLLVVILESGIPAPELNPNGHLATCDCDECSRKYRYRLP